MFLEVARSAHRWCLGHLGNTTGCVSRRSASAQHADEPRLNNLDRTVPI